MKAAQISKAGGDWEIIERAIPEPGPGQVRIKVEARGICHSDMLVKDGLWPGLRYPRIPGHEIGGRRSVHGWPSGTAMDSEDTLRFSALSGVRPMIEKFP